MQNRTALAIIDKLISSPVPLAVFKKGIGGYECRKITTEEAERRIRLKPELFIGVYSIDVKTQDLVADLEAAGII